MAVKSMLRVRMSAKDAHYGGNLVDGAHMLHLFGDVAMVPRAVKVIRQMVKDGSVTPERIRQSADRVRKVAGE